MLVSHETEIETLQKLWDHKVENGRMKISMDDFRKECMENRKRKGTPPKFNMEPENDTIPKGISFSRDFFSGFMLNFWGVSLRYQMTARPFPM